ncbi:MAG: HAD hydrolase family protein, partial [Planctomycetota bacterium]
MPNGYDVIVIDLDGTLLDRRGDVSERNRHALASAADAGVTVIIATGRSFRESRPSLERLGYEG